MNWKGESPRKKLSRKRVTHFLSFTKLQCKIDGLKPLSLYKVKTVKENTLCNPMIFSRKRLEYYSVSKLFKSVLAIKMFRIIVVLINRFPMISS